MKQLSMIILALCLAGGAFAQNTWSIDKGHSKIGFTVGHHMIQKWMAIRPFTARMTATKDDFSDAVLSYLQTASINSENEMRDKDLKNAGFFDVANFPTLTFKSTSLKKVNGNKYTLTGNLTIKGVTKPITMDVTF